MDLKFDGVQTAINSMSDLSQLNLVQMISGVRSILTMVESGLKADLLTKLPLIGEGIDLSGSFVGKLNAMVTELES